MAETIEFDVVREYSLFEIGITVEVTLGSGDLNVNVISKLEVEI